jgi:hypothetical protein
MVTGMLAMHCQGDWENFKMFLEVTHPWSLLVPIHGQFWLDDRTLSRGMLSKRLVKILQGVYCYGYWHAGNTSPG